MYIPKRGSARAEATGAQDFEDLRHGDEEEEAVPDFLRSKSNIERMETVAANYSKQAGDLIKKLMAAQDIDMIDREILRTVVRQQKMRTIGCISLPYSVMFFMLFAGSSYLHEDISQVYLIESALRQEFGGRLESIETAEDVWNWLEHDLLPKAFNQKDMYGEPYADRKKWSRVLSYNQLQGPIMVEQIRSAKTLCNDGEGPAGEMYCYPVGSRTTESFGRQVSCTNMTQGQVADGSELCTYFQQPFQSAAARRLRVMLLAHSGRLPTSSGGGYEAWIGSNMEYESIVHYLAFLKANGWIDSQTLNINVRGLLLNAELGRPRLEELSVIFSFSRGGGVHARLTLESLFLIFAETMTAGVDFLFVCMLLFTTAKEARSWFRAWKAGSLRQSFKKFLTLLEFLLIVLGWAVVAGYAFQEILRRSVQKSLKEIIAQSQKEDSGTDVLLGQEFHDSCNTMIYYSSWLRILIAYYHLILTLRFFTAFHAQPRLGVVTSTLESSAIDAVHFLVVLLPTFMAFAVSGCFIFGRRLAEFSTLEAAVGICFKMAMEGEYDWAELSAEHPLTTAFWVWSFMILVMLLMLNMVLAIVMEVYTEMRRNAGRSETVWATFMVLLQRLRNWRVWVSGRELDTFLETAPEYVSEEMLQKAFPPMCRPQMRSIVRGCRDAMMSEGHRDLDFRESMKMTMAVKLSIDKVTEEVREIQESLMQPSTQDSTVEPFSLSELDRGWLQEIAERMAVQNHLMLSTQWQLQQLQWQWQATRVAHGGPNGVKLPAYNPEHADDDYVL